MPNFSRFSEQYCAPDASPLALDYSALGMGSEFIASMEPRMQAAFSAMQKLEAGAIANPDENRMVGHYWLRDFTLIPEEKVRKEVEDEARDLRLFVDNIHTGVISAPSGNRFINLLTIGIGGSALGPQLVADSLGSDRGDRMTPYFMDNTDPEGIARVLDRLGDKLDETLVVVISKSGGTAETRNGMLLTEAAYKNAGLDFGAHAVAVTGKGSKLDQVATQGKWLLSLSMYDWVGGRTSVMSAVGLLPAALQGIDIDQFVEGARVMDVATRVKTTAENPSALLALGWFFATDGRGAKDMVVLPYRDRLLLFSRYLQQLVMESLGKEKDIAGKVVEQGIAVYGNKGSTDQHAYVQQLRDGANNFFAVFVEVLTDGGDNAREVESGVTAGDYLQGFLQGTRRALSDKSRGSMTIILQTFDAFALGALIALFERAVGFYASLVNINAYNQPGVEAGKKAAAEVLAAQKKLLQALAGSEEKKSADGWANAAGVDAEMAFRILQHLAANNRGVTMLGRTPDLATFQRGLGRSMSRTKWTQMLRTQLYASVVQKFGPRNEWGGYYPAAGKRKLEVLCEQLATKFKHDFGVSFSMRAVCQQVDWGITNQQTVPNRLLRQFVLNKAAAVDAGLILSDSLSMWFDVELGEMRDFILKVAKEIESDKIRAEDTPKLRTRVLK